MDRKNVIKKAKRIMCSTVDRDMIDSFCEDVIAILEEQEAVKPKHYNYEWRCGVCGHVVLTYCFDSNEGETRKVMANFCPSCGRKVKWDA